MLRHHQILGSCVPTPSSLFRGAGIRYILQEEENLAIKEQILGGSTQKQVYFVMCWWNGQNPCMNQSKSRSWLEGQVLWSSAVAQSLHAAFHSAYLKSSNVNKYQRLDCKTA